MLLKELYKKTAEATGDLIGNKIGKSKEKSEEIYILPEKNNKLLMILNCFE